MKMVAVMVVSIAGAKPCRAQAASTRSFEPRAGRERLSSSVADGSCRDHRLPMPQTTPVVKGAASASPRLERRARYLLALATISIVLISAVGSLIAIASENLQAPGFGCREIGGLVGP